MITREQVADLRPGDVVELAVDWWRGAVIRGPLWSRDGSSNLTVGPCDVRNRDGSPYLEEGRTLTVISRAPRPFYVNHHRDHSEPGDAVRDADDDTDDRWWRYDEQMTSSQYAWELGARAIAVGPRRYRRDSLPRRLRLLIDGATGLPPEEAS